jgi:plastocyanin
VCFLSTNYNPTSLTVAKGTTVTFHNDSGIDHTVNFDGTRPPGVTDVPLNNAGDFPRTFSDAGTWKFHCTQHAGMTGQVVVN